MFAGVVWLMPAPSTTAATFGPRPQQTQITGFEASSALFQVLNTNSTGGAIIGQVGSSQNVAASGAGLYGIFNPPERSRRRRAWLRPKWFGRRCRKLRQRRVRRGLRAELLVSSGTGNRRRFERQCSRRDLADSNSIVGLTDVDSSSSRITAAGIFGEDNTNTAGANDGVLGQTTNGLFGVEGTSGNGAQAGVGGFATTGYGVYGVNSATATPAPTDPPYEYSAMVGSSAIGAGVYGESVQGGTPTPVGFGSPLPTTDRNVGVYGYSNSGVGVEGSSPTDIGMYAKNDNAVYPALFVESMGGNDETSSMIFATYGDITGGQTIMYASGDFFTSGSITSGTEGTLARTRNPNTDLTTYSAQNSEDTVEDFGSAQLVNGSASVPLAADFRQTINGALPYMVFLTPYGDTNGLYIASRAPSGFVVRETHGGHSTLAFDYRIVARPYGSVHTRLPHLASLHGKGLVPPRRGEYARSLRMMAAQPGRLAEKLSQHRRFALNHIPAGPPLSAQALSQQFRLR